MSSVTVEHTLLHEEDRLLNTDESSPPESKRVRLDNSCNNNMNSMLNNGIQNNARWSCSADTSFVEPEILEDMGVGMLEDEVINDENNLKQSQPQECTISPVCSDSHRTLLINETSGIECHEEICSSTLDIINTERIDQNSYNILDLAVFSNVESKSDYSSREEHFTRENTGSVGKTDLNQFYLHTRRRKKSSITGEDKFNKLSDEIILMILKWLPKKCLVSCMLVCKRWCQIARDEALWTRLDLGSKVLSKGTLGHVLLRGVQILRLAQAEIADIVFCADSRVLSNNYISKLQYLDLSMAVISPDGLAALLSKCAYLKKLSLEKCVINRECCKAISLNTELEVLNLTMCEDVDVECISYITKLKCTTALSMAWCCLDIECVSLLCKTLPSSITRLNIGGCRKTMTDDHVRDLSKRCPNIIELDLSDCALLTINTVHTLLNFSKLEHLSLSRCYSIPQSAYMRLFHMPCLLYLDIFGLMSESVLKSLRDNCELEINKFLYSSIARPTVGIRRTSIWGLRVRD